MDDPPSLNQSSGSNGTHCESSNTSSYIYFIIYYSLMFLVGLVLNGFTLKVYCCTKQQPASSGVTIYLKNLAAADFLLTPPSISASVYCSFGASTFYLNMYASILFMGYIAANRYLKIVHPLGTHFLQTARAAQIISTVTWIFLLSMMTTYVLLSFLTQKSLPTVLHTVSCDVLHSPELSLLYKVIHTFSVTFFLVVLVSLVVFYYRLSRRLTLAQQRQPASSSSKKLAKSRRNMLVLVSVFCICFVPYHLVRLPYAFLKRRCSWSQALFYLKELVIVVSVLNVCFDPLIYFIFCKAFRAQLRLRNMFTVIDTPMTVGNTERKSSDGRTSTTINRKMLVNVALNQNSEL
ncbi:hypothetical protein Q5P01_009553 [Channa striata]|uniref:G-protein coupled receptors family 1 profile domain-containing protein n=1 Tax=Channa striata TaxID=64152 RepID=A0AA88MWH8_CHASR|nr:hypothetical protein Q5P01_009553 [Channa striata]